MSRELRCQHCDTLNNWLNLVCRRCERLLPAGAFQLNSPLLLEISHSQWRLEGGEVLLSMFFRTEKDAQEAAKNGAALPLADQLLFALGWIGIRVINSPIGWQLLVFFKEKVTNYHDLWREMCKPLRAS